MGCKVVSFSNYKLEVGNLKKILLLGLPHTVHGLLRFESQIIGSSLEPEGHFENSSEFRMVYISSNFNFGNVQIVQTFPSNVSTVIFGVEYKR